ncbi:MAG: radical SAM protein, partial [Elusimicrobia bacterium]|nr:radical SAM protein [Elusimicrobiota bacterium]
MSPKPGTGAQAATGLYLHVPFCSVKCRFCDFAAYPGRRGEISRYLESLSKEIAQRAEENPRSLDTLYVGGGTPSLLSGEEIERLLAEVDRRFSKTPEFESSLECNPETLTVENWKPCAARGSSGSVWDCRRPRTAVRKGPGAVPRPADLPRHYRGARDVGFGNLNIDLMYGLPGQTRTGWMDTVKRVIDLAPEHVSAYAFDRAGGDVFPPVGRRARRRLAGGHVRGGRRRVDRGRVRALRDFQFRQARAGMPPQPALLAQPGLPGGGGVRRPVRRPYAADEHGQPVGCTYLAMEGGQTPVVEETALTEAERLGEDLMLES